jgi:hypothetical protein
MAEPESHFATVAPLDPRYGSGCYRRVILLSSPVAGVVEAALEDGPHAFSIRIEHDGERVIGVRAHAERYPLSTCGGAVRPIQALVGASLSGVSLELKRHADPRANCTHLFDLAGWAIAHAARGIPGTRRYDISIPDAIDGRAEARLSLDGAEVLCWLIEHGRILAPAPYAGQQVLGGFTRWASGALRGDELEHALMLARGYFVSLARIFDMQAAGSHPAADHPMPAGSCYSYSPGVVEQAWSLPDNRRDFSASQSDMLRWVRPEE